jgi:hypothetical protein
MLQWVDKLKPIASEARDCLEMTLHRGCLQSGALTWSLRHTSLTPELPV